MFIDEDANGSLCYRHIRLTDVYLDCNAHGRIDTVFRHVPLTYAQAVQQWPDSLPASYYQKAQHQPHALTNIIHAVFPTQNHAGCHDLHRYQSLYFCKETPYAISRYMTTAGEIYGRSPAMLVLPDIKLLNEMEKIQLRAIHQQITPPLCVPEDGFSKPITLMPGAINYGGVDGQGRPLIQPVMLGNDTQIGEEKMRQKRIRIEEAFLVHLANSNMDHPSMTATHILQRASEKNRILHPLIVRQQADMLEPLIKRELDILTMQGKLPAPPAHHHDIRLCQIRYEGPINRLHQKEEAEGLSALLQTIKPFTDLQPELLTLFNVPAIIEQLAGMHALPPQMLRV